MAYIYKIFNDINDKVYIGKTTETIKERWKQHIKDSTKPHTERRILYEAMNKYGIKHFHIEQIEEIDISILNEKEIYWIEYYDSFHNGYNATKGGDGKTYLDYELIFNTWKEVHSLKKTAEIVGCHKESVRKVLENYNISKEEIDQDRLAQISKPVLQLDKITGQIINSFNSIKEAGEALGKPNVKDSIRKACKGEYKTAYGYKWRYRDE